MAALVQHPPTQSVCSIPQIASDISKANMSTTCKTRSQTNTCNMQKLKRKGASRNPSSSDSAAGGGGGSGKPASARQPPKEKEPHLVQRRNARERRRVQLVNEGFIRLRRKIPTEPRNKKLSKVKTLRSAINYILHLQQMITDADSQQQRMVDFGGHHHPHHHHHHQQQGYGLGMAGLIGHSAGLHHQVQTPAVGGSYDWEHYADSQPMANGYDYQTDVQGGYYY